MNQMDFVADSLLSTNHEHVLAKKRENFKKAIVDAINNPPSDYLLIDMFYSEQIAELIAIKTFDEGIVN